MEIEKYNGFKIRIDRNLGDDNEKLNLTEMWRANCSPENKDPRFWLRHEQTLEFIETLKRDSESPLNDLIIKVRGRHGGTWAHWQIAMEYARYLSPKFAIWCNGVIRKFRQNENNVVSSNTEITTDVMIQMAGAAGAQAGKEVADRCLKPVMAKVIRLEDRIIDQDDRMTRIERVQSLQKTRCNFPNKIIKKHFAFKAHRLGYGIVCPHCLKSTNKFEMDHAHAPDRAGELNGWLVCYDCNRGFNRGILDRKMFRFDEYIERYKRWNGGQRTLF